jgi:hypothetical protein
MKDLFGDIPEPRRGDRFTRHTDPSTSHKAARKARFGVTEAKKKVILLLGVRPLVDGELLARWKERFGPVKESVPRKRRGDLVEDGLVEATGVRRMFERCECKEWALTSVGREAFQNMIQG